MTACAALLCDHCRLPGRCCTGFWINWAPLNEADTALHALVALARACTQDVQGRPMVGLPFLPLYKRPEAEWLYWCPLLGRDGRCTDYGNRPELCGLYQPGVDQLCAEHRREPAA